jgi:hypothetical protein
MTKKTKKVLIQEKVLLDKIVELHNAFLKLEATHPVDLYDWVNGIHILQRVIGLRILRRDYPAVFKTIPK